MRLTTKDEWKCGERLAGVCRVRLVLYSSSQNAALVGNFLFFKVIISRSFFNLVVLAGFLLLFWVF